MTDARTPAASKPMWTRCPGCKDRIFNDKLDIGIHKGHCPADLMRRMQKIERDLASLDSKVDGLDEQVSVEPALTPDDIAPWEDDEGDQYTADERIDDVVTSEADLQSVPAGQYFVDDEDEPDYGVSRVTV